MRMRLFVVGAYGFRITAGGRTLAFVAAKIDRESGLAERP
jgi:hypothetical protein